MRMESRSTQSLASLFGRPIDNAASASGAFAFGQLSIAHILLLHFVSINHAVESHHAAPHDHVSRRSV
jgi:hypothetical protein